MERYRKQAGQSKLPAGYINSTVNGAATGVAVAESLGELGLEIKRYGDLEKMRKEQLDTARALEAGNAYAAALNDRIENPESGFLSSSAGDKAVGLTRRFDGEAQALQQEALGKLENDEQRQAVLEIMNRAYTPILKRVSEHEANETRSYRMQVRDKVLESGIAMVDRNPNDGTAFEAALSQGEAAIRSQNAGADKEQLEAAVHEYRSTLERTRLSRIAEKDPFLAEAIAEGSGYLLPEDNLKVQESIRAQAGERKHREKVETLLKQHPDGLDEVTLEQLRQVHPSEEWARVEADYESIRKDNARQKLQEDQERLKKQNENAAGLYEEYWAKGTPPPNALLTELHRKGELSDPAYQQAQLWWQKDMERMQLWQSLAQTDPNWDYLTPKRQEELLIEHAGTAPEERKRTIADLFSGIVMGDMLPKVVVDAFHKMKITNTDMQKITQYNESISDDQRNLINHWLKFLSEKGGVADE